MTVFIIFRVDRRQRDTMGHLVKGADAQDKGNSVTVHVVDPTVPFHSTDGREECPPIIIYTSNRPDKYLVPRRQLISSPPRSNQLYLFPINATSYVRAVLPAHF